MKRTKYIMAIIISTILLVGCSTPKPETEQSKEIYIEEINNVEENNLERISEIAEINKNTMSDIYDIYRLLDYDITVEGTNKMLLSHEEGDIIFTFNSNGILSDILLENN